MHGWLKVLCVVAAVVAVAVLGFGVALWQLFLATTKGNRPDGENPEPEDRPPSWTLPLLVVAGVIVAFAWVLFGSNPACVDCVR